MMRNGINSFIIRNYSEQLQHMVSQLSTKCLDSLRNGPIQSKLKPGLSLAIEAPIYCKDYAEWNIDRSVPLRQYFGVDKGQIDSNGDVMRYSYGFVRGTKTVGGDTKTTSTKPMPKVMKDMCKELSNLLLTTKINGCRYCNNKIEFNHVTVLYYLTDSKSQRTVRLNHHTDIEVSASNVVKQNNSQKNKTPTVVLALQNPKTIKFFKRISDGKKFEKDLQEIDKLEMLHGDIFVLHPKDERVIKRRFRNKEDLNVTETKASQFKHGVVCSFDSKNNTKKSRDHDRNISISVCFRQTQSCLKYSGLTHMLAESDSIHEDESATVIGSFSQNKSRVAKFDVKRKELKNIKNLERVRKKSKKFHSIS